MKKIIVVFLFLSFLNVFSQEDAWVYFNDKPEAQFFLENPLSELSQRSLDRRQNQGIVLSVEDAPIYQPYVDQISTATGITVKAHSKWLNCVHVRGELPDIQALINFSFVNHIRYANFSLNNKNASPHIFQTLNQQAGIQSNFNYGNSTNQIQMLNAQTLHQHNYTGQGKIIAVLDSGFLNVDSTLPFQRLFDNNLVLGGYNFVSQNTDVYSLHNHGTNTLSCMGAFVDGQLVGTAPDASYYLYVTEDVSSENPVEESYWVQAAEEADRVGTDIISTSLGYFEYDNPNYTYQYDNLTGDFAFASQGANIAFSKGMIIVASAGNTGGSSNPHINVPAEATNVLAVGAVAADEIYAVFSSVGPSFDGRIKPDVMAQGVQATIANTMGQVTSASGTSFACPIMAGAIASFWSAIPWATNQQIIDFVKQSADRFLTPDEQYGYGIPDFGTALSMAQLALNENIKNNFKVFPNPTKDKITFVIPNDSDEVIIIIYNPLGQKIIEQKSVNQSLDITLQNNSEGIYFYKIQSKNNFQSGKIIKN
ncbi:S8 family serine peptidase [Flavobacterium sp.]